MVYTHFVKGFDPERKPMQTLQEQSILLELLEVYLSYEPTCPPVCWLVYWLVGRSVIIL